MANTLQNIYAERLYDDIRSRQEETGAAELTAEERYKMAEQKLEEAKHFVHDKYDQMKHFVHEIEKKYEDLKEKFTHTADQTYEVIKENVDTVVKKTNPEGFRSKL